MAQTVCPSCGAVESPPPAVEPQPATCTKCSALLFPGTPLAVDDDLLQRHILETTGPVLVAVGAPWCHSCQFMRADLDRAAAQLAPEVRLLLLDSNESETARGYDLRGIPALLLFRSGKEIGRTPGPISSDEIARWVDVRLQGQSSRVAAPAD